MNKETLIIFGGELEKQASAGILRRILIGKSSKQAIADRVMNEYRSSAKKLIRKKPKGSVDFGTIRRYRRMKTSEDLRRSNSLFPSFRERFVPGAKAGTESLAIGGAIGAGGIAYSGLRDKPINKNRQNYV